MGVEDTNTIAELREKARRKQPSDGGMDRVRTFEYGLQQAISEASGFDLVTMGRPEGPDCYCAVNNLLRKFMDNMASAYGFVVMDNEAGMEHLSRRTTNNVDVLCIAAEATPIGVITAQRIVELAGRLPISVKRVGVIWNRADHEKELDGIESFGSVPCDQAVLDVSVRGGTVFDVRENSPAYLAVRKILEQKLNLLKT
jgi:CO dehydrogenase maturation factor